MTISDLPKHVPPRAAKVFKDADKHCSRLKEKCGELLGSYLGDQRLDPETLCFVALGSVGRNEALDASDLDIIPVLRSERALDQYQPHDGPVREMLETELGVHVSRGADLTSCTAVPDLSDQESIGGDADCSAALTRRVLLLSEASFVHGGLDLREVRSNILTAYAGQERTRGRHVLSVCNDIARYYRTLCIEYKAKVDVSSKDWCTRNVKLRHSRKFWYFATMLSIVVLAEDDLGDDDAYVVRLLDNLTEPPIYRLLWAAEKTGVDVRDVLERYAYFLEFMAVEDNRNALARVEHGDRYGVKLTNPFPVMKLNSDQMHDAMLRAIYELPLHTRDRLFDWFLL